MKEIFAFLNVNPAYLPFLFILAVVGFIMYRAHISSSESFSIYHLVVDSKTKQGSVEKIMVLIAGLAITWWFIDLVAVQKADWNDAVAYGGLMGLAKVASDVIKSKTIKEPMKDIQD